MDTTTTTKKRQPTLGFYHVTGEGEAARWNKIGAAWTHKDGEGYSLALDYLPLSKGGRLILRPFREKESAE
jgi:hypothetical protein